jgi:outer membrane protein assembly factor BamD (BamD/ComL family)
MTNRLPVQCRRGRRFAWRRAAGRTRALAWAALFLPAFAGCKTGIDASALQANDEAAIQQMSNTDDVHGPMERFLSSLDLRESEEKKRKKIHYVNPPEAMALYKKGEDLMKEKKYKEAETVFWKEVAEKYKDYPIREDAIFLSGECYYFQRLYADADDQYSLVVKEYSTTRHMDEISRRKFAIARKWLGFPSEKTGIITASQVQPVNFDDPSSTPAPKDDYRLPSGVTYTVPLLPNFTDRTRPWFDTQGRALDALKSIWLNDPTGPLADDALMLSASYYLRKGDYVEADHLYELLRKEFNHSKHLENAYVLGAHCKLMSYQGPDYGGTELDEAKKLIQTTLKLYPHRPDRDRMEGDLKKIELAKAAQLWSNVKFWKVKANPKAVAICCKEVIQKYPNSDYARMAREELAKIKPADKVDIPHPKAYEDKVARFGNGEPSAFDEPGTKPKHVPVSGDDADPAKM